MTLLIILCVCWWYMHATAHVWRSEGNSSLHDEFSSTFTWVLGLNSGSDSAMSSSSCWVILSVPCTSWSALSFSPLHGTSLGMQLVDHGTKLFGFLTNMIWIFRLLLVWSFSMLWLFYYYFFYSAGIEPRTLPMLGKHSTTVLRPQCTATMMMNFSELIVAFP